MAPSPTNWVRFVETKIRPSWASTARGGVSLISRCLAPCCVEITNGELQRNRFTVWTLFPFFKQQAALLFSSSASRACLEHQERLQRAEVQQGVAFQRRGAETNCQK